MMPLGRLMLRRREVRSRAGDVRMVRCEGCRMVFAATGMMALGLAPTCPSCMERIAALPRGS